MILLNRLVQFSKSTSDKKVIFWKSAIGWSHLLDFRNEYSCQSCISVSQRRQCGKKQNSADVDNA